MDKLTNVIYQEDINHIENMTNRDLDISTLDSDGRTVLMHAVLESEPNISTIQSLLDQGVDIDHQDSEQRWSALHFAARDNKKEVVALLLNSGASVDLLDVFGNTPLWRAVMSFSGECSIVKNLLSHGAEPTKKK